MVRKRAKRESEKALQTDDRGLVANCLAGRADAFRQLVESYQSLVFGVCVRMVRDRHEAEDIAQEVFLRVHRSLHTWDPDRPLRSWLITIAANRCRTWLAKSRIRLVDGTIMETLPEARPAETDAGELRNTLSAAVHDLRPEYRLAFQLFHEQGLGYGEMSEVMSRPVGTLKTWLHRARVEILAKLRAKGLVPELVNDERMFA